MKTANNSVEVVGAVKSGNRYSLNTVGELKIAIKYARRVNVFVAWSRDDGDYVEVKKSTILRDLCIDTANDGAHGGRDDGTAVKAHVQDGEVFIG